MITERGGMVTLVVTGLDELMRIARTDLGPVARGILLAVGHEVEAEMMELPPKPTYPLAWTTKMRRAYFAKRHEAGLTGPWKRESDPQSERLHASWTVKAESDYKVMVNNSATYGPWVQSQERQAIMHHVTGWKTDLAALIAVDRSGAVERIAGQAIQHVLEGHP